MNVGLGLLVWGSDIFTSSYIVLHDGLRYFPDHDRPVHGRRHEVAGEVFEAWDGDCEVQDRTRMLRQLFDAARNDRVCAHRVDPLLHLNMGGRTKQSRGGVDIDLHMVHMVYEQLHYKTRLKRTPYTTYTTHVVESQPYSNTTGNGRYRCLAPPHYRSREGEGYGGERG